MTEETKPTITIDGTDHAIEDLNDTQKRTLNHIAPVALAYKFLFYEI